MKGNLSLRVRGTLQNGLGIELCRCIHRGFPAEHGPEKIFLT